MSYNVKELLVLPAEEKIILADLLYSSVNEELEENKKPQTGGRMNSLWMD